MFPSKYFKYGSIVVLSFMAIVAIIGCSQSIQPKAWLSVEKAPMRVIVVDNEKDIEPEVIHMIIDHLENIKYENYHFNTETGIGINHVVDYDRDDHTSSSITVGGKQ